MGQEKGKDEDRLMVIDSESNREAIRLGNEYTKPPVPSENALTYTYHCQCWGCLVMLEGKQKSDNQMLEIECERCGKVSHVYGRKIKRRA